MLEGGSLFTLSGAEGLPLFLPPGARQCRDFRALREHRPSPTLFTVGGRKAPASRRTPSRSNSAKKGRSILCPYKEGPAALVCLRCRRRDQRDAVFLHRVVASGQILREHFAPLHELRFQVPVELSEHR